ncbi:uncharacterized protein LOC123472652 [Daphnia magna]|uniref:uncharacterized protein LOC123472652 n=1 Tax=Daphnia magna TaxID=35525 RepID=UPI001E1BB87B|nr:uncharacterized protein LOC123472652 [Daphnia magna]
MSPLQPFFTFDLPFSCWAVVVKVLCVVWQKSCLSVCGAQSNCVRVLTIHYLQCIFRRWIGDRSAPEPLTPASFAVLASYQWLIRHCRTHLFEEAYCAYSFLRVCAVDIWMINLECRKFPAVSTGHSHRGEKIPTCDLQSSFAHRFVRFHPVFIVTEGLESTLFCG